MALGFDEKFIRIWEYYFDYCAAGFKSRTLGNYQVLSSLSLFLINYSFSKRIEIRNQRDFKDKQFVWCTKWS
jgi:hypothetical protein